MDPFKIERILFPFFTAEKLSMNYFLSKQNTHYAHLTIKL